MLLRPRPSSTAVDEGEAGADLEGFRRGFSTCTAGLSADVGNDELSSAREGSRRRHDPDGSEATSPLNCCRGGWGGLFVVGELFRDFQEWARLGLVLVEERGEAEQVQRRRLFLVAGDDQLRLRVYVVPVGEPPRRGWSLHER